MGAEASVAVVAVGHKVEAEPVFVTDNWGRDITARQPETETETETESETFYSASKTSGRSLFFSAAFARLIFSQRKCKTENKSSEVLDVLLLLLWIYAFRSPSTVSAGP